MTALRLVSFSSNPEFLIKTLELVNNLEITEQEGIDRVVRKLGENYRKNITQILDDTRPKTLNFS